MSTLASRSGEVHVRVGGNTQDFATLVDYLDNGLVIHKLDEDVGNPTATPPLLYTRDLFYMMNNISHFVPVKWYLGQYLLPSSFFSPGALHHLAQAFRSTIPQTCDCRLSQRERGYLAAIYLVTKWGTNLISTLDTDIVHPLTHLKTISTSFKRWSTLLQLSTA